MGAPQGDYRVERMPFSGVETVIDWAAAEGWNPGLGDAACFYAIDPNGFFMGVLDGRPIARVAMLVYDESFAFCGLYMVDPAYRGHAKTVHDYVIESVLEPGLFVVPGYPSGTMPTWYGAKLSALALEKIASYLERQGATVAQ